MPASLTHERQVEAMVHQVCQAVRAVVDTVVDRTPALWPRCRLERGMPARGPPQRSPGMTHLHQRLQRLEAQAWEVEGRRLAQMTEAALDAEIVRVEAHYGVSIQDYECFVETLSASELEALGTADLGNHAAVCCTPFSAGGTAAHEPGSSRYPCGPPRSPACPYHVSVWAGGRMDGGWGHARYSAPESRVDAGSGGWPYDALCAVRGGTP